MASLVQRFLRDHLVDEMVEFKVLSGFARVPLGMKIPRIEQRERLIDEDAASAGSCREGASS